MQKGNIGVTTENIFPVIKKFLYSDHEIFLREMVSNAVDATQKIRTLADKGDFKGELGDLTVRVSLDEKNGTLTISDHGIGMTEEEIDKYINQIAFSGVNDFLDKYKDNANAIIGHFGLGFYSAFMVSKKVEKTAVGRNRIRRRVYEAIRRNFDLVPKERDYIFVVFQKEVGKMAFSELEKTLGELVKQSQM